MDILKLLVATLALSALFVTAPAGATPAALDAGTRHQVVAALITDLNDEYVFPAKAAIASQALLAAEHAGAFDRISDPKTFAMALTAELARTLHDKHLRVRYSADPISPPTANGKADSAQGAKHLKFYKNDASASQRSLLAYAEDHERRNSTILDDNRPSADTFSGGEEFAYDLQTQKRATLVGETTGGGANPGRVVRLTEHFGAFIPNGRAINPITKTNWEGVGVTTYVALLRDPKLFPDPNDRKYLDDVIAHSLKDPSSILTQ